MIGSHSAGMARWSAPSAFRLSSMSISGKATLVCLPASSDVRDAAMWPISRRRWPDGERIRVHRDRSEASE